MATMKVDTNRFPKVLFQLDGDDSTPAADTVAAYVAADGTLHLVDEAGTDTAVGGGAVADILDLPTAETDDTLVLAPDGAGGVEWRAETGGGGGGAVRLLDPYLSTSGSARNDEFDTGSALSGSWTLVGTTPAAQDVDTTLADHLYLKRTDTGAQLTVYYQSLPSAPCSIAAKIPAAVAVANYVRAGGIVVMPASPTTGSKALYLGYNYNSSAGFQAVAGLLYSPDLSTYGGQPFGTPCTPGPDGLWLRVDILSGGTTADLWWSTNGTFWTLGAAAVSLGFTAGTAGIGMAPEGQAVDVECVVDWYRASA